MRGESRIKVRVRFTWGQGPGSRSGFRFAPDSRTVSKEAKLPLLHCALTIRRALRIYADTPVSVKKHSAYVILGPAIQLQNCYLAPELMLLLLNCPCVFFSGGVFFSQTPLYPRLFVYELGVAALRTTVKGACFNVGY